MFNITKELASIEPGKGGNLPDFCRADVLLRLLLAVEMGTILLVLIGEQDFERMLQKLALSSLFFLLTGLLVAAGLCPIRRLFRLQSRLQVQLLALLWVGLVVVASSYLVSKLPDFLLYSYFPQDWNPDYFMLRNLAVALILAAMVLRYFDINAEAMLQASSESRARFETLQAKIRPHFLFNSLNSIASLTHSDPDKAEAAIEHLSELLRASLSSHDLVPAEQELALCQHYLELQKLRLQERLHWRWQVPSKLPPQQWPLLLLQPLLENAIQHGIEQLPQGGSIDFCLIAEDHGMTITLSNPFQPASAKGDGHGLALNNIRERLLLLYGSQAHLQTQRHENHFSVQLFIPRSESA